MTDEQYKDLEEFLKDLANSKRKMDIPSSDKVILRRVVSSLPTGIELLKNTWKHGIPRDYYQDLVNTLTANVEVDKSLQDAEKHGNLFLALEVFIGIEDKLKVDLEVFNKYLSDGIKWWLSQNINLGEDKKE